MTKTYRFYRHVRLSRPHAAIKPGRSTRIATANALLLGQSHEVFRQRSRRRSTRKSFSDSPNRDDLVGKNHTATKFSINSKFVISLQSLVFVLRRPLRCLVFARTGYPIDKCRVGFRANPCRQRHANFQCRWNRGQAGHPARRVNVNKIHLDRAHSIAKDHASILRCRPGVLSQHPTYIFAAGCVSPANEGRLAREPCVDRFARSPRAANAAGQVDVVMTNSETRADPSFVESEIRAVCLYGRPIRSTARSVRLTVD